MVEILNHRIDRRDLGRSYHAESKATPADMLCGGSRPVKGEWTICASNSCDRREGRGEGVAPQQGDAEGSAEGGVLLLAEVGGMVDQVGGVFDGPGRAHATPRQTRTPRSRTVGLERQVNVPASWDNHLPYASGPSHRPAFLGRRGGRPLHSSTGHQGV